MRNVVISRTASCIGEQEIPNSRFLGNQFLTPEGNPQARSAEETVGKLGEVSGIRSRVYVHPDQVASDLAVLAFQQSDIDPQTIDGIIFPHNFGDSVAVGKPEVDWLPSKASVAKKREEIRDPTIVSIDVLCDDDSFSSEIAPWLARSRLAERFLWGNFDEDPVRRNGALPDYLVHQSQLEGPHPSLASRLAHAAGISDRAWAYDVLGGCAGCLVGVIHAYELIRSGFADRIVVSPFETLSREVDPHDMNGMLYADGGGLLELRAVEADEQFGILSYSHQTDSDFSDLLTLGSSFSPVLEGTFIKMNGRRLRQYASENVPKTVLACLRQAGLSIHDLKMALLHQANTNLNTNMMLGCGFTRPEIAQVMPMVIQDTGNFSVGTVPYLIDRVFRGTMDSYTLDPGDYTAFVSVGAGATRAAVAYKMPPADVMRELAAT